MRCECAARTNITNYVLVYVALRCKVKVLALWGLTTCLGPQHDESFVKVKFKPGTYVRLAKSKNIFEKGYTAKWSKEIFIVDKVFAQVPLLYQIKKLDSNETEGIYYAEELQKVELPFDTFEVLGQTNDSMLVKQINSENSVVKKVDKDLFLKINIHYVQENEILTKF